MLRRAWHVPVVYLLVVIFAACSFPDVIIDENAECYGDADCDNGLRCSLDGMCVACVENNHCPMGMVCAPDATCVGCQEDSDCEAPEGLCDPTDKLCVECTEQQQQTCTDLDEVCAGGVCAPAHCNNGMLDEDEVAVDCGGSVCAGCGTGVACTSPDECKSGICEDGQCSLPCENILQCADLKDTYCSEEGICRVKKDQGDDCDDAIECQTGSCADGVCCNEACEGPCRGCTNGLTGEATGTCAFRPVGTVDEGCTVGCCNAGGTCAVVACL